MPEGQYLQIASPFLVFCSDCILLHLYFGNLYFVVFVFWKFCILSCCILSRLVVFSSICIMEHLHFVTDSYENAEVTAPTPPTLNIFLSYGTEVQVLSRSFLTQTKHQHKQKFPNHLCWSLSYSSGSIICFKECTFLVGY